MNAMTQLARAKCTPEGGRRGHVHPCMGPWEKGLGSGRAGQARMEPDGMADLAN